MGYMPEQVQDFYPTPGTISTAMYYTEIDPRTMKPVYVAKTYEEKDMQRALLQWRKPDKRDIVKKALLKAGRPDLIGYDKKCLVRPEKGERDYSQKPKETKPKKEGRSHTKRIADKHGKKPNRDEPQPKVYIEKPARKGKNYRHSGNKAK